MSEGLFQIGVTQGQGNSQRKCLLHGSPARVTLLGLSLIGLTLATAFWGCQSARPVRRHDVPWYQSRTARASDELPAAADSSKGRVIRVKPPDYPDRWATVGIVYPLRSSPADVAAVVGQSLHQAAKQTGQSCRSALVCATDAQQAVGVVDRLRNLGMADVQVVAMPCEDDDAVYRAATAGVEGDRDVVFVVRGKHEDQHLAGGEGHDQDRRPWRQYAFKDSRRRPSPGGPAEPAETSFIPTAARALSERLALAGIDFTDVRLVSVNFSNLSSEPALHAVACAVPGEVPDPLSHAGIWKTFVAALALPDEVFWVNLNPSEPNRIIDPELAKTDIGRIMLEADLQLKRDTADIIDPRKSEAARRYWHRLTEIAGGGRGGFQVQAGARTWIVPGPLRMECSGGQVYIADVQLNVMLESQYVKTAGGRKSAGEGRLNSAAEALAKEIILPALRERVNSEPQYAALRQAYYSLVLARWCRAQASRSQTILANVMGQGRLPSSAAALPTWDFRDVYRAYVQSFDKGFLNTTEREGLVVRTYFCGGIDWTDIPIPPAPPPLSADARAILAGAHDDEGYTDRRGYRFVSLRPLVIGKYPVTRLPTGNPSRLCCALKAGRRAREAQRDWVYWCILPSRRGLEG